MAVIVLPDCSGVAAVGDIRSAEGLLVVVVFNVFRGGLSLLLRGPSNRSGVLVARGLRV